MNAQATRLGDARVRWSARDNSATGQKIRLRNMALGWNPRPRVLECCGGWGRTFERVWFKAAPDGLVLERDPTKCAHLAKQRPTWRVYQCEHPERALANGLAHELRFDLVDADCEGSALPFVAAVLGHPRALAEHLSLVATDGGRNASRIARGALAQYRAQFGSDLFPVYIEVLRCAVETEAQRAGFEVSMWHAYYCGRAESLVHFWVQLQRQEKRQ